MLLGVAGRDASSQFKMFHKPEVLAKYGSRMLVGVLLAAAAPAALAPAVTPAAGAAGGAGGGGGGAAAVPSAGEFAYVADTARLHGSTEQSWDSGGTAGELPAERAKATFRRACAIAFVLSTCLPACA